MGSPQRRSYLGLAGLLFREPYRFEFFQAVRLLERSFAEAGDARKPVGEDGPPDLEVVRFGARLSLSFPAAAIYELAGEPPAPVTPEGKMRYADFAVDRRRQCLFAVREDHTAGEREAVNTVVRVPLGGGDAGTVVAGGNDFYSNPRPSPDGSRLAWLTWNHPNMPWDGTELWVAELEAGGQVQRGERVAGGEAGRVGGHRGYRRLPEPRCWRG